MKIQESEVEQRIVLNRECIDHLRHGNIPSEIEESCDVSCVLSDEPTNPSIRSFESTAVSL